jgi:hypothetical protein
MPKKVVAVYTEAATLAKVKEAFDHVQSFHHEITQVIYNKDGSWFYCDDEWSGIPLSDKINYDILHEASKVAGWPSVHYFGPAEDKSPEDEGFTEQEFGELPKGTLFVFGGGEYCKVSSKKAVRIDKAALDERGMKVPFFSGKLVIRS